MYRVTVGKAEAGRKLHRFLRAQLPDLPAARMHRAMRTREIRVNGAAAPHTYMLQEGDVVESAFPFAAKLEKATPRTDEAPVVAVLFEDEHLLVVNKPAGLAMHPGTGINQSLVQALAGRLPLESAGYRPSPVHRLDRETPGVVIVAKTLRAHQNLAAQFERGSVRKTYLAVTEGVPGPGAGTIDRPLERRSSRRGEKMRADDEGIRAVTAYRVLADNGRQALVELTPKTGRLHQLRAHLKSIGCPVVNDARYGAAPAHGPLWLHALRIRFDHPETGRDMAIEAPIPAPFVRALSRWKLPTALWAGASAICRNQPRRESDEKG